MIRATVYVRRLCTYRLTPAPDGTFCPEIMERLRAHLGAPTTTRSWTGWASISDEQSRHQMSCCAAVPAPVEADVGVGSRKLVHMLPTASSRTIVASVEYR